MKFSTIFSGLIAALAFTNALPIDDGNRPDVLDVSSIDSIDNQILEIRNDLPVTDVEDKYHKELKRYHSSYSADKWYVFYDTTPRGQGDKMGDDAERVRDKLRYDHIKVVLGQYKEERKETGPPKKRTGVTVTKKWVNLNFYDLVVKDVKTLATEQRIKPWDPAHASTITFQGQATKGSNSAASNAGKAFIAANPVWGKCESSHCGGFVDAVHKAVK